MLTRSFADYLAEAAFAADQPVAGDVLYIELSETEIFECTVLENNSGTIIVEDSGLYQTLDLTEELDDEEPDEDESEETDESEEAEMVDEQINAIRRLSGYTDVSEAEYHGHHVELNKPMQGDVAKSKVYVKDPSTGNVKKVNFGDKNMRIKKSIPARRRSFRARHHCENPGPKTKARYWSCRAW